MAIGQNSYQLKVNWDAECKVVSMKVVNNETTITPGDILNTLVTLTAMLHHKHMPDLDLINLIQTAQEDAAEQPTLN